MQDDVIIVNEQDEWMGTVNKLEAHREGILHRAFSIFILNNKKELLIQQRAFDKYHSGGLWSNSCCSHPSPGESTIAAAHRRLKQELGFDCELEKLFTFRYNTAVNNDFKENEFDHIYMGVYNGTITIATEEVNDYRYVNLDELKNMMENKPGSFTPWLRLMYPLFIKHIETT